MIVSELTVDEFNKRVGGIVMNLQAIETMIRFFFFRKNAEQAPFPKECGDDYVPSTSLTTYCQLRKWIRRYNSALTKEERERSILFLRNTQKYEIPWLTADLLLPNRPHSRIRCGNLGKLQTVWFQ